MKDSANLWDFALALYSSPGVEKTLLDIQDRFGANVNILLWACWLQKRKIKLSEAAIKNAERAIADWDCSIVQNIRLLRRRLKTMAEKDTLIATLRDQLKAAELLAERHCLDLLGAIPVEPLVLDEPDNVILYLEHLKCSEDVTALQAALVAI